jgi:cytochrome c553
MIALVALFGGCWESDPERIEREQDLVVPKMQRHDAEAGRVRQAIVDGDLAAAKRAAAELQARLPIAGLPTALDAHQAALAGAAAAIAAAPDLAAAAAGVGELALACGSCHGTVGMAPPSESDMPNGEAWEDAMARHRWAADEMWTSIVWMSGDRFARSVTAWNDTPLVRPHTQDEKRFSSEALAIEDRIHDVAARAATTPDVHERAALYGTILAGCAQCHALVRAR